ncbi:MAG: sugar phosphate isomerase/epimerase [Chloroflexi bacterium]|nr:sugar phosphate isomerase/epimerase [Chloroflexota bacterium]
MTAAVGGLKVSLAAWSLHRAFFARELDQMGMLEACGEMGIAGFEMVNTFFPSPQYAYLRHLRRRAEELGIELLLIMCDLEGDMGHPDREKRLQAARNHRKWVDIAAVLGCHGIRCNVRGDESDPAAMRERAAEAFGALLEYADGSGVDLMIENHGGLSSDADWLVSLIELVGSPRLGTLPDFGNFAPGVDRYESVAKLMPFAKAVSAKCYDFGPDGRETAIDFARMLEIVKAAGYRGFVGIEFEGERLPERDGIQSAKAQLERLI